MIIAQGIDKAKNVKDNVIVNATTAINSARQTQTGRNNNPETHTPIINAANHSHLKVYPTSSMNPSQSNTNNTIGTIVTPHIKNAAITIAYDPATLPPQIAIDRPNDLTVHITLPLTASSLMSPYTNSTKSPKHDILYKISSEK